MKMCWGFWEIWWSMYPPSPSHFTLKPCISSDGKGYAENCSWKSKHSGNSFGVNPHSPFLLPSTTQSPLSFGSLMELHLLGKRGQRGHSCSCVWVGSCTSEQWEMVGSWLSHTIKTCVWPGLHGIKPAGAEAKILHSLECLGEPEKGWSQLYLVRVSWQPVSHRSLPHKHFLPVFVSLQTNVVLIAITAILTQCSC